MGESGPSQHQFHPVVLTASAIPLVREERDRLIVATALTLDFPLITSDRLIAESGLVETIWD